MQYLYFSEEKSNEYELKGTLLSHCRISEHNRARLFSWLSDECARQGISRYSYVLTCSYIDLFFMKKNSVELSQYQVFALGALILATKQAEVGETYPILDFNQFNPCQLLQMESKIIQGLNYFLNPPIHVELLNNLATMWDMKCQSGSIDSKVRYFTENDDSFMRLKILYEKMDCLNLFKRILDFEIHDVVVTLFQLQTNLFDLHFRSTPIIQQPQNAISCQKSQQKKIYKPKKQKKQKKQQNFKTIFKNFLNQSQVKTKSNPIIQKIIELLTKQKFPVKAFTDEDVNRISIYKLMNGFKAIKNPSFSEKLSFQTHNSYGFELYRKYQADINKL